MFDEDPFAEDPLELGGSPPAAAEPTLPAAPMPPAPPPPAPRPAPAAARPAAPPAPAPAPPPPAPPPPAPAPAQASPAPLESFPAEAFPAESFPAESFPAPEPSPGLNALPDWPSPAAASAPPASPPAEAAPAPKPPLPQPRVLQASPAPTPQLKPAGAPKEAGAAEPSTSRVRSVAGLAVQFSMAAVLVLVLLVLGSALLGDGQVVLDPARLQETYFSRKPLVARDLSNGLYETRAGRPVFFVRGEVLNRGETATRVRARVALYDEDQRVKSAEALAGALPTPEELHALQSPESTAELRRWLDSKATPVAPGERVPFIVIFQEYPQDLDSFRLEVTLEEEAKASAER